MSKLTTNDITIEPRTFYIKHKTNCIGIITHYPSANEWSVCAVDLIGNVYGLEDRKEKKDAVQDIIDWYNRNY